MCTYVAFAYGDEEFANRVRAILNLHVTWYAKWDDLVTQKDAACAALVLAIATARVDLEYLSAVTVRYWSHCVVLSSRSRISTAVNCSESH